MQRLKELMRKNVLTYKLGRFFRRIECSCLSAIIEFQTLLRSKGLCKKKYKKLSGLRGKYSGKRCFIIATGPSLTNEDVLKLRDEYTFTMNAMCLKFNELNWRPTFYGIQDSNVFEKLKTYLHDTGVKFVFVDDIYRTYLGEGTEFYYFPRNSYYNSYDAYIRHIYKAKFSDDPSVIVYDGFSIAVTLLQIAVYLGFEEIYLLGCDCNYKQKNAYFVDHGFKDPTFEEAGNRMMSGYRAAKEYADKRGVRIYNATRGGMLEIFPRVNLDEILSANRSGISN